MKKAIITLTLISSAATVMGQSFTDDLRRVQKGQGTVIINQSADIERLVNRIPVTLPESADYNGNKTTTIQTTPSRVNITNGTSGTNGTNNTERSQNERPATNAATTHVIPPTSTERPTTERPATERPTTERTTSSPVENETESVNTNKKIMRNSYKTTGYRIQVYSGGNKRVDRQKCEQIAARLKSSFPNLPIYVHFYSPSWKCRAGNFTDYAEAQSMLRQVKAMGYTQACLVKGTISVQY